MNHPIARRWLRRSGRTDLRGIAFTLFTDFALQLSLIFLMALAAAQAAGKVRLARELDIALPALGAESAEPPQAPLVVEWDGQVVALAGKTIGSMADPGTLGRLQQLMQAEPADRQVVLRIPDGPYTQLRQAISGRPIRLEVR